MKTYELFYRCHNCYFVCIVHIEKGKVAPVFLTCPNCDRNELDKTEKKYSPSCPVYQRKQLDSE